MTSPLRSTRPGPAPTPAPRPRTRPAPAGHLRVVAPPARRGRRILVGGIVVVVVFGALLVAAILQSVLVTGQDRLDRTNQEIAEVERQLQIDRAELAVAQSPERLAAEAARLGMVVPAGRDWVTVDPGITVSAPTVGEGEGEGTDAEPTSNHSELASAHGAGAEGTSETR